MSAYFSDKATVDSEQREFLIRELKPNREYGNRTIFSHKTTFIFP